MLLTWSIIPFPPVVHAALQFFWFLTFTLFHTLRASNTCNTFIPVSLTIFIFLCNIMKRSFDGPWPEFEIPRASDTALPTVQGRACLLRFFFVVLPGNSLGLVQPVRSTRFLGPPAHTFRQTHAFSWFRSSNLFILWFLRRVLPCFQLLKTVS